MSEKKKRIIRPLAGAAVLAALAVAVFYLNHITKLQLINRTGQTFETGMVVEILEDNIQEDGMRVGQQTVVVHMTSGEKKGEDLVTTSSAGYLFGAACTLGMKVIVIQSVSGETVITSVYSTDRTIVVIGFAAFYLLLLCVLGGRKGVRGALGLVFTFVAILFIYLPMVYLGCSPFWTSVLICALATAVTMVLIAGFSKKAFCATAGTVSGVIMAGITATVFSRFSGITGWNVSNIESLITLWQTKEIQVGGLLFSGLLISTLGAVMDVTMSVSSSMQEVCVQNPQIQRLELMRAGMRVGRDIMGTDANTLILAFAGTSISMLVLDYAYDLPFLQIVNSNNIGIAVMQGLAGSYGVILSVPATVLVASYVYCRGKGERFCG